MAALLFYLSREAWRQMESSEGSVKPTLVLIEVDWMVMVSLGIWCCSNHSQFDDGTIYRECNVIRSGR
jgi:hypothetical protein